MTLKLSKTKISTDDCRTNHGTRDADSLWQHLRISLCWAKVWQY